MRALLLSVLTLLPSMLLIAGGNKEQQEAMQIIMQVLDKESVTTTDVPKILLDDEAAKGYCMSILNISDEQYSQDTARANNVIRNAEWINQNMIMPDEGMTKKLAKKKYDTSRLDGIYCWADDILRNIHPRYGILIGFCNRQLQLRREALQKTMPQGKLVSFYYGEYGSSRPNEVVYELHRDNATNRWLLNGKEVADTVADKVRELAESGKTFQCLSRYMEAPSFPKSPQVMGGPPSWRFSCKFEGGNISSESECMPVPAGCSAIVNYLKTLKIEN